MEKFKNEIKDAKWVSLKSFIDEVTYNKIHRHLTDINDTITEEDIRNVKIYSYNSEVEITTHNTFSKK